MSDGIPLAYLRSLGELARQSPPTPGLVYRHFDAADVLLYVGYTQKGSERSRHAGHVRTARWWRHVDRIEIEQHPDKRAARAAEVWAIRTESPVFNLRTGDPGQAQRESAYEDAHRHVPPRAFPAAKHLGSHDKRGPMDEELARVGLSQATVPRCGAAPRPHGRVALDLGEFMARSHLEMA